MQPEEQSQQIFVLVIDETYDLNEQTWEEESEDYRRALESEFETDFEEVNVGPGADIPAFLTIVATTDVPLWSLLLGALFLGKPINDNLEAWVEICRKIKSFFDRPVIFARHGAGVLAIGTVFEEMGGMPKTLRLMSYRTGLIGEEESLAKIARGNEIFECPETLSLGYLTHIFEIEADGIAFRVRVDGKDCEVLRL